VELSFVIPVYNASDSIARVVDEIFQVAAALEFEIILVNDASEDQSEEVCKGLTQSKPNITFLQLARNFGEHNAVLAGLHAAKGDFIGVLDDDGQNPPAEVIKLFEECKAKNFDVVYGKYEEKKHHLFRNLGSKFNDKMANLMLKKPTHIYLSSFKVINRFLRNEIIKYSGANPYIDGLIFRSTSKIGQILVQHKKRDVGSSNYTLRRLIRLWLNMFVNHSIYPLRLASVVGALTALASLILIGVVIVEWLLTSNYPLGIPLILVCVMLFAGIQLVMLGVIGEYLGRMFLDYSGLPQFVVRSTTKSSNLSEDSILFSILYSK